MSTSSVPIVAASLCLAAFPLRAAAQVSETKLPAPACPAELVRSALDASGKSVSAPATTKGALGERLARSAQRPLFERVLHDRDAQGVEYARGTDWKASFDASGASFVPFLGATAPQNHPVHFALAGLTVAGEALDLPAPLAAARAGETITLKHGGVLERYELAPGGLEQSFVVPALPARGELVLRLAVQTDLAAAVDGDGLRFGCELGGVRYGRATALDAAGRASAASVELDGGSILIRVPEAFVAQAELPLTIDPGVSTFTAAGGTDDDIHPDVAYLVDFDQYEIVWEEAFSASDHDVYGAAWNSQGVVIANSAVIVDSTSEYWAAPRIASYAANETFLIVAQRGAPGAGPRAIVGRILPSPSNTIGPVLSISGAEPGDKTNPDVCGDGRTNGGFNYCVFLERTYSPSDHDIYAQFLTPITGSLLFPQSVQIDNSAGTLDQHPALPKYCSKTGLFSIVWEREVSANDHDIHGARYGLSGTQFSPSTPLWVSIDDARFPSAASGLDNGDDWLLAFQVRVGADWDVMAAMFNGTMLLDSLNVSELEQSAGSNAWTEDQVHVCAATDGDSFEIAYSESFLGQSTDHDLYIATLGEVAGALRLGEGHVAAGVSFTLEDFPRLCPAHAGGGPKGAFYAVWQDTGDPTNAGDVIASRFVDQPVSFFCFPGYGAGICPCNNPPAGWGRGCDNASGTGGATLSASGSPSLGTDTLHFLAQGERPTATSVLLSGTAVTDVAFGQGRRCVGGTLKRLYIHPAVNGAVSMPAAGDPSIHARSLSLGDGLSSGAIRYYSVYYRDPVVLGGCAAQATFNATPAGAVTWRP